MTGAEVGRKRSWLSPPGLLWVLCPDGILSVCHLGHQSTAGGFYNKDIQLPSREASFQNSCLAPCSFQMKHVMSLTSPGSSRPAALSGQQTNAGSLSLCEPQLSCSSSLLDQLLLTLQDPALRGGGVNAGREEQEVAPHPTSGKQAGQELCGSLGTRWGTLGDRVGVMNELASHRGKERAG